MAQTRSMGQGLRQKRQTIRNSIVDDDIRCVFLTSCFWFEPNPYYREGPIIGGSFDAGTGNTVPRAVSKEYFYKVCPKSTIIRTDEIKGSLGGASASVVVDTWVKELNSIEDECVEFHKTTPQVFDFV